MAEAAATESLGDTNGGSKVTDIDEALLQFTPEEMVEKLERDLQVKMKL